MTRRKDYTDLTNENLESREDKIRAAIFLTLWGLVKYIPSPIGWFFRYAVLKIFCKKIESYRIDEGVQILHPENISIGKHVRVHAGAQIGGVGELILEDWSGVAVNGKVLTDDQGFRKGKYLALQPVVGAKTVLGRDAGVAAGGVVTKGMTVNLGAIVLSKAVVMEDVPTNACVSGNPARVIGYRTLHSHTFKMISRLSPEEIDLLKQEAADINEP